MLAKRLRLVKEKDFKTIFKLGKSFYAKIFRVKILANKLGFNRYGIVIRTKVSKKAVERNKLKRQLRSVIKEFDQKIITGLDLVIIVSPIALNQEYKIIKKELERILFTLKLFKLNK